MRIATYNINNVVSHLAQLKAWLDVTTPDVVRLQEIKTTATGFPREALEDAGYGSLVLGQKTWNGVAILARGSSPIEIRRGLPGDPEDRQARYLEAAVNGIVVGCLYLPNGNPQPGPKFDYELAWFARLHAHAEALIRSGHPIVLAGDYNVVPTDEDMYATDSWKEDALLHPKVRMAYRRLLKQGWCDALKELHPDAPP
jgi:exodeoxyribonuclease-3